MTRLIRTPALLLPCVVSGGCALHSAAPELPLSAPDVVEIFPRLTPAVPVAVVDERTIVQRQGLSYQVISVKTARLAEHDFQAFAKALSDLQDRKVLVNCHSNMMLSAMVFLYRAIVLKADPPHAYEAVSRVWAPDGIWKRFIAAMLAKNGIAFEPY